MSVPKKRRIAWKGLLGNGGQKIRIVIPIDDLVDGLTVIQQEVIDDDLLETTWQTIPVPPMQVLRKIVLQLEAAKAEIVRLGGTIPGRVEDGDSPDDS